MESCASLLLLLPLLTPPFSYSRTVHVSSSILQNPSGILPAPTTTTEQVLPNRELLQLLFAFDITPR
ncbi:hypothetical protein Q5P01_005909 [Channa striata]|uniref:Uncharacterized protein n=1 Tax=Channa striata TaxID=64152 RepID=A0AA88NDJ8_CHASR|nr:hypothetical protein Q5P01_005909 [Channa striata]